MKAFATLAAICVMASFAFADLARPDDPKKKSRSIETTLDIRLDAGATEAKLIIPRSQLKQLRAELEQLDDDSDATAGAITGSDLSRTQTIVSGVFLSLALVFGGVWLVRSGRFSIRAGKAAVGIALVCAASAVTFVYANAGPPLEVRTINGKMFSQAMHIYGFGWGRIRMEVGDTEDRVRLIVPNPKTSGSAPGEE